jgi:hypothetical protein
MDIKELMAAHQGGLIIRTKVKNISFHSEMQNACSRFCLTNHLSPVSGVDCNLIFSPMCNKIMSSSFITYFIPCRSEHELKKLLMSQNIDSSILCRLYFK